MTVLRMHDATSPPGESELNENVNLSCVCAESFYSAIFVVIYFDPKTALTLDLGFVLY
jgi:hypothetical protein